VEVVELDAAGVERWLDDLAQLLLDAHASNIALGLAGPLTPAAARAAWRETAGRLSSRDHVLLAALEGETLVGSVQLVRASAPNGSHRAEVRRLAVRSERRGRRIGAQLLAELEAVAHRLGITLLWLTTHTGSDAEAVYERLGWIRMGEMPGYAVLPDGTLAANAYFYRTLTP
jgi:acetyltransferase